MAEIPKEDLRLEALLAVLGIGRPDGFLIPLSVANRPPVLLLDSFKGELAENGVVRVVG